MKSEPMLAPREIYISSTGGSEERRTHNATIRRTASPTQYQLSYSGPCHGNVLQMCVNRILGVHHSPSPRFQDYSFGRKNPCMNFDQTEQAMLISFSAVLTFFMSV